MNSAIKFESSHHRLGQGVNDYVRTRLFELAQVHSYPYSACYKVCVHIGRKRSVVKPEYLEFPSSIIVLTIDLRCWTTLVKGDNATMHDSAVKC